MATLTKRQKQMVDFLDYYIAENGYAPTLQEIGQYFGLASLATVHKHLKNLELKGYIRRRWNHSRALELVTRHKSGAARELPLLGQVAAGTPIEAIETNDTIAVPEDFVRRENTFCLRVRGESMIDEGIRDGDFIIVEARVRFVSRRQAFFNFAKDKLQSVRSARVRSVRKSCAFSISARTSEASMRLAFERSTERRSAISCVRAFMITPGRKSA